MERNCTVGRWCGVGAAAKAATGIADGLLKVMRADGAETLFGRVIGDAMKSSAIGCRRIGISRPQARDPRDAGRPGLSRPRTASRRIR
jgi:hypothetical protein